MNRALLVPFFVYIVAEFFDSLRNFPSGGRLVLAAPDLNIRRAPIPCIPRDPSQSLPVKRQKMRGAEFEWLSGRVDERLDHSNDKVELPEPV